MDLGLEGRRAIVSGGSRGIGFRVAAALLAEGSSVVLLARSADRLASAVAALKAPRERLSVIVADTSNPDSARAAVDEAATRMGGLDILVNAAANPAQQIPVIPIQAFDERILRAELETKLFGYIRTIKAAAPYFLAQRWGRIINIGGQSVRRTGSITATIRNAAVSALTRNVADELGPHGITANVVHPGYTITESTPQSLAEAAARRGKAPEAIEAELAAATSTRRLSTADEVAAIVVFLASSQGATLNGEAITTGGGAAGFVLNY